jgi:hypothetical protein
MDEMGGACRAHREMKNAYKILVGKLEETRPLGRPRRKWLDNIRADPTLGCRLDPRGSG